MLTRFQTSFLAASSGDVLGWDFPLHPSNKAMDTRVTRKKKLGSVSNDSRSMPIQKCIEITDFMQFQFNSYLKT
jgi:hypothetical protein